MDGRPVGDAAHLAAQGVDFLDELSLGEAPDGRVARHEGEGIEIDVEQECVAPHARGGQRCLAPGMAGADHDDVITLRHACLPPLFTQV